MAGSQADALDALRCRRLIARLRRRNEGAFVALQFQIDRPGAIVIKQLRGKEGKARGRSLKRRAT